MELNYLSHHFDWNTLISSLLGINDIYERDVIGVFLLSYGKSGFIHFYITLSERFFTK